MSSIQLSRVVRNDAADLTSANCRSQDHHLPWVTSFTDQAGFEFVRCLTGFKRFGASWPQTLSCRRGLLADDFVLDWLQSKERIRGIANFAGLNTAYPAQDKWVFTINRIVAAVNEVV
jgi:hypothetical protein